ncbi:hypothetical protein [Terrabacter sp. 2YAF2]|uniref:hypothetical protein n=1 Tax=Terrabacter sp. 2YAF2 TaxID=3233026 RepID=UPI003F981450
MVIAAVAVAAGIGGVAAPADAVGTTSNNLKSVSAVGHLASGGIGVVTSETVICDPGDQYSHPTLSVQVSETINGVVYYGYNYRDGSNGGWVCTGKAQSLNVTALQQNGQPAFRKGTARVRAELYGYDRNGTWFDYVLSKTITIK